jgi:aminoglycoside phosphotransferase (APT) family kinase protein
MTPEQAIATLEAVGFHAELRDVQLEERDGFWLAKLDGHHAMAWFPTSAEAAEVLRRESRVLELVAKHCSFEVPRLLVADPRTGVQVRSSVAGLTDHQLVFERVRADSDLAVHVGTGLGGMLANLHDAVPVSVCSKWLPHRLEWPPPRAAAVDDLRAVQVDAALIERADRVLTRYEELQATADDVALVHGDIGFHNTVFDPRSLAPLGLFDFKGAAVGDRQLDFRYLVFDLGRFDLLDAACAEYVRQTGRGIDRARVLLYNAVWAISFLAHRVGTPPDDDSCGRTLQQDVCWTRNAIAAVLG